MLAAAAARGRALSLGGAATSAPARASQRPPPPRRRAAAGRGGPRPRRPPRAWSDGWRLGARAAALVACARVACGTAARRRCGGGGGGAAAPAAATPGGLYLAALRSSPVLTKGATSAALAALGDLLAQLLGGQGAAQAIDAARLCRFAAVNGILVGPAFHVWYGWLSTAVAQRGLRGALRRTILDQLVFSPAFLFVFLSCVRSTSASPVALMPPPLELWLKASCANWLVLPITQFMNFLVVPVQLQVLFSNVVAVGMSAVMSYLASSP